MVLDMARPKNRQSTTWPGMRGRDAVRTSTPKVNIHDRLLRDPVCRETQLGIAWREQKCKEWDELAKQDHPYRLSTVEKKRHLNKAGKKWAYEASIWFWSRCLNEKNRLHHESGEQVEEPHHSNQYSRWHPSWSTSWWDKSEWNWKWAHTIFSRISFLLQLVSFTVDSDPLLPINGGCRQKHLTRNFLMHLAHVFTPHRGSKCLSAHFTPSTCQPWCHMFELSFVVSSCLSLSCSSPTSTLPLSLSTSSLSGTPSSVSSPPKVKKNHCTHEQWGVLHHGDTKTLPQDMSPSSSTTSTNQRLLQRSSRMNSAT